MIELIKDFLTGIGINVAEWQTILFLGLVLIIVILLSKRQVIYMFYDIYNVFKDWLFGAVELESWQLSFLNILTIAFIAFCLFWIVRMLFSIVRMFFR